MRLKEAEAKNYGYLAVKYDKTYERLRIFEDLLKEEPKLDLGTSEQDRVHSLIKNHDFRRLCANCNNETIILAFIFSMKLLSDSHLRLHK